MNPVTIRNWAIAIGALVLLIIAWKVFQWFKEKGIGGVAKDSASGAVELAGGLVEGVVTGVGKTVGIPATEPTACEKALDEGRFWDASFDCPAGTFVKNIFNRSFSNEPLTGTTK